ncbi:MAG TPA: hypothetical protein DEG44_01895 [Candidatus Kerfeldbacteria bacterium]|nr:hypothetical protein [Candidatus Kerfeldbacteria bacterium]
MQIFIHRVNQASRLSQIDPRYGVEIDLRADGDQIILNHEPFAGGEDFADYLKQYHHAGIILNIKEAGIEQRVLELCQHYGVTNYFLLDVEFPYIYRATRAGVRQIALRYSEDEAIETVLKYRGLADWVWIDTNTKLPLDATVMQQLQGFKTCLVCPERWGRPQDIAEYINQLQVLHFPLTAVMAAEAYVDQWSRF